MGILKIKNLMKCIEDTLVLNNLSLDIEEGTSVGIRCIGNEVTVLFDLIEGRMLPSSGQIQNDIGKAVSSRCLDGLYENLTVKDYLTIFAEISDVSLKDESIKIKFSIADCWQTKIKKLSVAQKKRIELLRLYLSGAPVLLVESPLDNIDPDNRMTLLNCFSFLKNNSRTLLFTSDNLEHLFMLADKVYLKRDNGLAEVKPDNSNAPTNMDIKKPFRVSCRIDDRLIFFSPDEIDYAESINGISNISVGNETYPTALTMSELEERLTAFGFFRCHRSCLVNLQRVRELINYSRNSYAIVLNNKSKKNLPLSRDKVTTLKEMMDI